VIQFLLLRYVTNSHTPAACGFASSAFDRPFCP